MSMVTRPGSVVTYDDGLSFIKSHDPLITWSCEITGKIKPIKSPPTLRLSKPKFLEW